MIEVNKAQAGKGLIRAGINRVPAFIGDQINRDSAVTDEVVIISGQGNTGC